MKKKVNKNVHKVLTRVKAIALIAVAVFMCIFGVMKPPSVVRADGPFKYEGASTESISAIFSLESIDFFNYDYPTYSASAYPQARNIITYDIGLTVPRTFQKDTFSYIQSESTYTFNDQDTEVDTTYFLSYRMPVLRDYEFLEYVFSPVEEQFLFYDETVLRYTVDYLGFDLNSATRLYCGGVRLNYSPFFLFDTYYQLPMLTIPGGFQSFTDYRVIHSADATYIDKNGTLINSFHMSDTQTIPVTDVGFEIYCPFLTSSLTNYNLYITNYEILLYPYDYSNEEQPQRYNLNEDGRFSLYDIHQYVIVNGATTSGTALAYNFEEFSSEFFNRVASANYTDLSDVGNAITRTIDNLLSIEIFPDFSFYSILILVVVLIILAAVIKMFLGGH